MAVALALALGACTSTSTTNQPREGGAASSSTVGSGASSTATLFTQLRKNGAAAKSVRIKGSLTNGTASTAARVKVDIAGDRAGKNTRVTADDGTGIVEILTAGGKSYLKADAAFWTKNGSAAIARSAAGKYVEVPAGSSAVMGDISVGKLLDRVFAKDLSAVGKLNTKVTASEVNGVPAYLMTTKADGTRIYVSTDAQARLLRVEGVKGAKGQGTTLDFSQWNAVPPASAPPASQLTKIPGL